jgi:hypothetical protein
MLLRTISRHLATALAATACLAMLGGPAVAMNDGGGTSSANRYFGMRNVYWNGLQIAVWSMPGRGVHAYKVSYPADYAGPMTLSEGWHFCANQTAYAATLEDCMGVPPTR